MMVRNKFLHFGCWNNTNEKKGKVVGNLNQVMKKLNNYLKNQAYFEKKPFLVLAGDNYYPEKKKSEMENEKKEKIIYLQKMLDGFNSLPTDVEINMILGNHDLETNGKKKTLFIENVNTNEKNDCYILNNEMRYVLNSNETQKENNIHFILFKEEMLKNGTLLLMLDTSMYGSDVDKYLPCYSVFLKHQIKNAQILIDMQNEFIKSTIEKYSESIQNIIMIGHHPIIGIKNKKTKHSIYNSKSETEVGESKIEILNDIPYFVDTLKMIKNVVNKNEVEYFYLCADLHLFQKGVVHINDDDMKINQYIVGTGGTELDDDISKELSNNIKYNRASDNITYEVTENEHDFGFLECLIREGPPIFTFISATKKDFGGGLRHRTKSKFKKIPRKKLKLTRKRNKKHRIN